MAIVTTVTIRVKKVEESLISEAYETLKSILKSKFGESSKLLGTVRELEEDPKDDVTKDTLVKRVAQVQADKDNEILEAAKTLLKAIESDPKTATIVGIDLEEIKAESLKINNIVSTGIGVSVKKGEFQGSIAISNVFIPEKPNLIAKENSKSVAVQLSETWIGRDVNLFPIYNIQNQQTQNAKLISNTTSIQQLCEKTKKCLINDQHKIRLQDLVIDELEQLCSNLSSMYDALLVMSLAAEEQQSQVKKYLESTKRLQYVLAVGCYFDESRYENIWIDCLERIAYEVEKEIHKRTNKLQKHTNYYGYGEKDKPYWLEIVAPYAVISLLYAGGIASIANNNYKTISALLTKPVFSNGQEEKPIIFILDRWYNWCGIKKHTDLPPVIIPTQYIYETLREPLKRFIFDETKYKKTFERFEYLLLLVFADLYQKKYNFMRYLIGYSARFFPPSTYRAYPTDAEEHTIVKVFEEEVTSADNNWSPLQAGLFDGSIERFKVTVHGVKRI